MKKFLILLVIINLNACSYSKKENIEPTKTNETIIKPENVIEKEDEGDIGEINNSLKSFEPGSSWLNKNCDYENDVNKQIVKPEPNEISELKFDELYLYPGEIGFSFEISSENQSTILFQLYNDEDELLLEEKVSAGLNLISYKNEERLYTASIKFIFKDNNFENTILIENFKIKQSEDIYKIHINQVGYQNDARKIAIFSDNQGDYYNIVNFETKEVVMQLPLSSTEESSYTNEHLSRGDFTELDIDGVYYIESSMGFKSHDFVVANDVYDEVLKDALNFFTIQRCGYEIDESISKEMAHGKCHQELAKHISTSELLDVTGGWHDAGDYGRYVETAVKALSDLMMIYILNPNTFSDSMNYVDSGNNVPDILDEIRYELEWLLKMQREDGGVYSRAVSKKFPGNILPDEDEQQVYVMQVSTSSSAGFCSVMAIASMIFNKFDSEFSKKCLEAALKANEYLNNTSEYNPVLPGEFSAGDYALADDDYYRFYSKISLWYVTNDQKYLDEAFNFLNEDYEIYNVYWEPLLAYPSFLYLMKADKEDLHYDFVAKNFFGYINSICEKTGRDSYRISLNGTYTWGSNQNVADKSMLLLMGYELTGKRLYKAIAEEHLDYLLGKNFHDMSFVVGHGDKYPHNIHHRVAICNDSEFKGALVGGPDASMEDPIIKDLFEGTSYGPARIYVDDQNSYSTNEVAIHFNSALVFALGYLNQGK